jgi:predicted nucleic acid-binding protein
MPYFTYDTSVIISRKPAVLLKKSENFLWSAVVLMELMASATDDSQRKVYDRLFDEYSEDNSLITPNEDDWRFASKVLYLLSQDRRRRHKGTLKRLRSGASQRMALDVLLAVSARRWKATVVTENWDDFKAIERYTKTKIVRASAFLKH